MKANKRRPCARREGMWGSRCIAPFVVDPNGYKKVRAQPHAPPALLPVKEPEHQLNGELGGPQKRF